MSDKHYFKGPRPLRPGKTAFDLSYTKKFTCDMGQLIPVLCEEVVPGDKFIIGNQALVRFQPLVAPIMHQIDMYVHYFYVPYRLLDDNWETFITGGVDGQDASSLPLWNPTNYAVGSLWDYFGFPIVGPAGIADRPIDYPRRAYNLVWSEYYRDETLQAEILPTDTSEALLLRNWEKDYFTSALPWQQRGTAPAFPVGISGGVVFDPLMFADMAVNNPNIATHQTTVGDNTLYAHTAGGGSIAKNNLEGALNRNTFGGTVATFNVSDLRLAVQVQRWLERNARAGVRYTEFLRSHFGVNPRDERLQRPEYFGGTRSPIVISEVLQTSETGTTPQGNLAGHGMNVSNGFAGSIFCPEFGLVIGLMSIMPKPDYNSQGVNRQWLRRSRYDFYFPEFANLSEQGIITNELVVTTGGLNRPIFGYQARYDEMRTKQNLICGQMRTTFAYWHLARTFSTTVNPLLNESFIQCVPRKDIFAAPAEPGLIIEFGNLIKAIRPIPRTGEPGRLDHDY